jgi:hypothetical protein
MLNKEKQVILQERRVEFVLKKAPILPLKI